MSTPLHGIPAAISAPPSPSGPPASPWPHHSPAPAPPPSCMHHTALQAMFGQCPDPAGRLAWLFVAACRAPLVGTAGACPPSASAAWPAGGPCGAGSPRRGHCLPTRALQSLLAAPHDMHRPVPAAAPAPAMQPPRLMPRPRTQRGRWVAHSRHLLGRADRHSRACRTLTNTWMQHGCIWGCSVQVWRRGGRVLLKRDRGAAAQHSARRHAPAPPPAPRLAGTHDPCSCASHRDRPFAPQIPGVWGAVTSASAPSPPCRAAAPLHHASQPAARPPARHVQRSRPPLQAWTALVGCCPTQYTACKQPWGCLARARRSRRGCGPPCF